MVVKNRKEAKSRLIFPLVVIPLSFFAFVFPAAKIEQLLPYLQVMVLSVSAANHGLQIADRFAEKEKGGEP